jgi:hypothetical protein
VMTVPNFEACEPYSGSFDASMPAGRRGVRTPRKRRRRPEGRLS